MVMTSPPYAILAEEVVQLGVRHQRTIEAVGEDVKAVGLVREPAGQLVAARVVAELQQGLLEVGLRVGFGRIVASEIEVPNMLANLV